MPKQRQCRTHLVALILVDGYLFTCWSIDAVKQYHLIYPMNNQYSIFEQLYEFDSDESRKAIKLMDIQQSFE